MRFRIGPESFRIRFEARFGGKLNAKMRFRIRCTVWQFKILFKFPKFENPIVAQREQIVKLTLYWAPSA